MGPESISTKYLPTASKALVLSRSSGVEDSIRKTERELVMTQQALHLHREKTHKSRHRDSLSALESVSSLFGSVCAESTRSSHLPAPGPSSAQQLYSICKLVQRLSSFLLCTTKELLLFNANDRTLLFIRLGRKSSNAGLVRLILNVDSKCLYVGSAAPADVEALRSALYRSRDPTRSILKYSVELEHYQDGSLFDISNTRMLRLAELGQCPAVIRALLNRMHLLTCGVYAKVPQLVVYFPSSSGANGLSMKCMVLPGQSGPLPTFRIQFSDGTSLAYCLQTGQVSVHKPHMDSSSLACSVDRSTTCGDVLRESVEMMAFPPSTSGLQWTGLLAGSPHTGIMEDTQYLPPQLLIYIQACQQALELCLKECDRMDKRTSFPNVVVCSQSIDLIRISC